MTTVERFEQNIDQVNSDFQAIKSKLIECGVEVADGTRTAEYAEKVGDLYELGRKAEYDAFWDKYQENGERRNYSHAFAGVRWDTELFKPKYDIKPVGTSSAYMMFSKSTLNDLVEVLEQCGVTLDLSGVTGYESYTFYTSSITRIGKVDLSNATHMMNTFGSSSQLHTIEELHISDKVNFITTFLGCTALVNLTITGTIGKNGFDVSPCTKLSRASIISVLEALSKDTSGLTVTLSKAAVDVAFYDKINDVIGSESEEWGNAVISYRNWTISLL